MMFFSCNLSSVNPLEYVSMNNQEWEVRPDVINVNSKELVFYTFSIKTNICSGSQSPISTGKDKYAYIEF